MPDDKIRQIVEYITDNAESYVPIIYPNAVPKDGGKHFALANKNGDPPNRNGSFRITLVGQHRGHCRDFDTDESMDLLDATMYAKKLDKSGAIQFAKEFMGSNNGGQGAPKTAFLKSSRTPQKSKSGMPGYGSKSYRDRGHRRLLKNDKALEYLDIQRGLHQRVFNHFQLGLGSPNLNGKSDALLCPVMDMENGRFFKKTCMYNIPGVTINPVDSNGWCSGSPMTYPEGKYAGQKYVFVCEGAKDLWANWDKTRENKLAEHVFFISSTHGTSIPFEWEKEAFWARFEKIYCGQDNDEPGDKLAYKLAQLTGRECRRVMVPAKFGKDWTDFWMKGRTIEEFIDLIKNAPVVSRPIKTKKDKATGEILGDAEYRAVDINGAYHNGHLYYSTTVKYGENVSIENGDKKGQYEYLERKKTVVIRSDRTKHTAFYAKAPKGTRLEDRICRLSDNTIIKKPPKPSDFAFWSFQSIQRYLQGKSNVRAMPFIYADVYKHIHSTVWLPYEDDYTLLSMLIFVSFVQQIFDAVPYCFLNGPAGTGKSHAATAVADISYNGTIIGSVSGATLTRMVDESRGLVVIDDLEALGQKRGSKVGGGDALSIEQILKVGYQKRTGVRAITDTKTGRIVEFNFYGVKIVNNTSGVDNILGTRMFRIQTRKMPDTVKRDFAAREKLDPPVLSELRDELYTWAFENTKKIEEAYRRIHPDESDRQEEIAASLRTVAALIGSDEISESLERSIERINSADDLLPSQEELVYIALKRIVVQGYKYVTINQIKLEIMKMVDPYFGKDFEYEIPDFLKPEWIGRQMRNSNYIDENVEPKRTRMQNVTTSRAPRIHDAFITEAYEWAEEEKRRDATLFISHAERKPGDFCKGCAECEYRLVGCDVQEKVEKRMLAKVKLTRRAN